MALQLEGGEILHTPSSSLIRKGSLEPWEEHDQMFCKSVVGWCLKYVSGTLTELRATDIFLCSKETQIQMRGYADSTATAFEAHKKIFPTRRA